LTNLSTRFDETGVKGMPKLRCCEYYQETKTVNLADG
jgi:hypothetical protein